MPVTRNNLLLVEDDARLRVLLTAILARFGYRVRSAEDGFGALAEIRADMPDLILSDLYMLGMSGFELLSVVRRRFPTVSVIAMSSAFTGGHVPVGVAADAFYQKATSVHALLSLVDETSRPTGPTSAAREGDPAPIWIGTPASGPGSEEVIITCPECLRTFTCPPGRTASIVRNTDCTYCATHIDYALVQTVDPGPPRPSAHHKPRTFPARTSASVDRDRLGSIDI